MRGEDSEEEEEEEQTEIGERWKVIGMLPDVMQM